MKGLRKFLIPTDLSENSRRALSYGCWLAGEDKASLVILHVAHSRDVFSGNKSIVADDFHSQSSCALRYDTTANELSAWEYCSEDLAFIQLGAKPCPANRVLAEASLDLTRFLEPSLPSLKNTASATNRVVLGPVAQQIAAVAEQENADLVIMSPHRRRGFRHLLFGAVTDQVTRLSPCPVLSITPPLPSKSWRHKWSPVLFGWPRQGLPSFNSMR
jgi:nucleotide-binding universal stress UspA family protein